MLLRISLLLVCIAIAASNIGCSNNERPLQRLPAADQGNDAQSSADHSTESKASSPKTAASRRFEFHYAFQLNNVSNVKRVRIWIPVPQNSTSQIVKELDRSLPNGKATIGVEPLHGNTILYIEPTVDDSKPIEVDIAYDIQRIEILGDQLTADKLSDKKRELYLAANRRVPIDGKAVKLIASIERSDNTFQLARAIYDRVGEHMRYDKSQPGYGNGDSEWACQSGFGNCTDFHSLFIALARSRSLPGRFEIGFPLPTDKKQGSIGGYHCWAFFHDAKSGWVPTDISEADKHPEMKEYYFGNLTADRVTFTTGRDIELVPKQDAKPLNFFVYPHIEIDGQVASKDNIELKFRFRDIEN